MVHPCDDLAETSDALEGPLTALQCRIRISDTLMDWMQTYQFNFAQAADACNISTNLMVSVCNRATVTPRVLKKLSAKVPGLLRYIEGAN